MPVNLVEVAQETLAISHSGEYTAKNGTLVRLGGTVQHSVLNTQTLSPEELAALVEARLQRNGTFAPPQIEITPETTTQASRRLYEAGHKDVVALNFASAKKPGGGFLTGARSQEEDLARCSALYDCLVGQTAYYDNNRAFASLLYTDWMVYSSAVPFFRDDRLNLVERPFFPAIITAPAPNAGEFLSREPGKSAEVRKTLERRAGMVLALAAEKGHRTLVLGAWGCGVFRNIPADVASVFADQLKSPAFAGAFDLIVFGIYERDEARPTLETFKRELAG